MKTFLTKTGILASNNNQAAFFTNSGDFVRECSYDEFLYLTEEKELPEITHVDIHAVLLYRELNLKLTTLPKWKFLFSSEDVDDTNYKWETCNNGGDYSNTDRHNYFVRLNGGKVEFACLTESYSSAEFHQTWNGSYQGSHECEYTHLIDVEGDWKLSEWQREESEASLLQGYGQICKLEDLFLPSAYTPSRHEEDTTTIETPVSFAEYLRRWRLICAATNKTPYQVAERRRGKRHGTKNGRRR